MSSREFLKIIHRREYLGLGLATDEQAGVIVRRWKGLAVAQFSRGGGHPLQPLALIYTDFLQSGKQEMRKKE